MLGKRSPRRVLFEADHLYLGSVGEDTFHGFLARHRGELFRDQEFAEFYSSSKGRPSVPPSLLATALLLQSHDNVSDEEAKARADYDLRWKVALGVEVDARPFAKSTLQLFRAQLVLKEKMREIFERSLAYARESGYLKKRKLRVVLDTTYILGRGAVQKSPAALFFRLRYGVHQVNLPSCGPSQAPACRGWPLGRPFSAGFLGVVSVVHPLAALLAQARAAPTAIDSQQVSWPRRNSSSRSTASS